MVDIGNLDGIRYALPVAILDLAAISGGLTVRFATGDESFTALGSGQAVTPEPGEVIFIDAIGYVTARRWCWRQSAESASSASAGGLARDGRGPPRRRPPGRAGRQADLEGLLREYASRARDGWSRDAARPEFDGAA